MKIDIEKRRKWTARREQIGRREKYRCRDEKTDAEKMGIIDTEKVTKETSKNEQKWTPKRERNRRRKDKK